MDGPTPETAPPEPEAPATVDIRLSGSPTGEEPGWDDRRVARWTVAFLALGVALRLLRLALNHPLWRDEAYLAWNVLDRDYAGLTGPLDYQQVCPLLFLWLEKAVIQALGFREWTLRLVPTAAAVAGLFLFRRVAGRLFRGPAVAIGMGILAVGFTPIRHGGEVKPYATDFLVALALIGLAAEWARAPDRVGPLWALAALGPIAVGLSNPSIFVAAGVGIVLAAPVLRTRSPRAIAPLAAFGLGTGATFLALLRWVNGPQGESVMPWMRVYWARAFPPSTPLALAGWLARAHTSQMFAYPAGGDAGASALTTGLVLAGIVAYLRRGPRTILAVLLAPFALGLAAAALGRYPYGVSARTMQYVAPSIILLAGLGAAVLLARLPRPSWRTRAPAWALGALGAIGVGLIAWDVAHPYMEPLDRDGRTFARRFWAETSEGAEVVCARTDLHLPLDAIVWQGDRAAVYLCHQAIYSPRHRAGSPPRLDRVDASHPLRIVVFGETRGDAEVVARWIRAHADRFALRSRRERVLNPGRRRGKALAEDRYVVYELGPAPAVGRTRDGSADVGRHLRSAVAPSPDWAGRRMQIGRVGGRSHLRPETASGRVGGRRRLRQESGPPVHRPGSSAPRSGVRRIASLAVRAAIGGRGGDPYESPLAAITPPAQEEDRFSVHWTVQRVERMDNFHRPPQFAGPSVGGQLMSRMGRPSIEGVDDDLGIVGFEGTPRTGQIPECAEGRHESRNGLFPGCRTWPVGDLVGVRPPPTPLIPGYPSDAIVSGRRRTGDFVVIPSQARESW